MKTKKNEVNPDKHVFPPEFLDLIFPQHPPANGKLSAPRRCDTSPTQHNTTTRRKYRRRSKKLRQNTEPNAQLLVDPAPTNRPTDDTYTQQVRITAPPLRASQPTYKHKSENQKGQAKRRKHKTRRQSAHKPVFDNTKNKSKTRQKLRQFQDREIQTKKPTKHDTNEKDLFRQLETLVQDHIEKQLKLRHNGQLPYKRFSRRPSNTDSSPYTGTS
jgi:hypothetical protein